MTAEQFIDKYNEENESQFSKYDCNTKMMVEFAKYQVEKVVHQILDRVDYGIYQNDDGQEPYVHESNIFIDHSTIHNAYDLNDIK